MRLYLDFHATTPCSAEVLEAMTPYFADSFGNSASVHQFGRDAQAALEQARCDVAAAIGAQTGEVAFTSGTTESNALAITGAALFALGCETERRQIVMSSVEHKSVLNQGRLLERLGFEIARIPVSAECVTDLDALESVVGDHTLLVSVQAVNNVVGTIQPISEVARIARKAGALVHTDAAQALGKSVVSVGAWDVDFASFSSHKVYGPKGVGALYVRGGISRARIQPLAAGGGQERGLRSGTANVVGAVGFGVACDILASRLEDDLASFGAVRASVEARLEGRECPEVEVLGGNAPRVPTCTAARLVGIEADALSARLPELAFSTGSACESGAPEPSHVFLAMGLGREAAGECVRLSYGRGSIPKEACLAVDTILDEGQRIRALNESVAV